ncbi:hypothetical protein GCM10007852_18430 [Agaribacter marinus]|uniref:O-glycosylation ligase, exosortase A system-associated n=1 Tax=Agaribacter marinus TaxID=1431249 RepID=A0AA37SZL4_9ALTE|nr:hypothetical protein GCM10007852_18430 [Agaribacter marinus]
MYHFLMLTFMLWITISTVRAEFQLVAWLKYDFTIKTLIFAYFIPFALTSKKHIEFFVLVSASALSYFIFMGGVKSLLGGGGYGVSLIGLGGFMYAEGSTLSALSISLIPIFLYIRKHSLLVKQIPPVGYLFLFLVLCSLAVLVGTQARTGLVALAVLVFIQFFQSKKKFKYFLALGIFGTAFMFIATDAWFQRMSTIDNAKTDEKSAIGRLVVWRWTIDYVKERPFFGGGFYSYNANAGQLHKYQQGQEVEINQRGGKAFHNIYFEVLGETGYGGLILFLGIILHGLSLLRSKNMMNNTEPLYSDGKRAIRASLIIYISGGMFIGVAFYPWMYYLYCVSIAIKGIEALESDEQENTEESSKKKVSAFTRQHEPQIKIRGNVGSHRV